MIEYDYPKSKSEAKLHGIESFTVEFRQTDTEFNLSRVKINIVTESVADKVGKLNVRN